MRGVSSWRTPAYLKVIARRTSVRGVTLIRIAGVISVIRVEDSLSRPPPVEEDVFLQCPRVRGASLAPSWHYSNPGVAVVVLLKTVHTCEPEPSTEEEIMSDAESLNFPSRDTRL
jgi:hypothetical protein